MKDLDGRTYAKHSELRTGSKIQVDGFEGCFEPWSIMEVFKENGELVIYHNTPECGACGNHNEGSCPHNLAGQIADDGDSLIGVYHA